MAAMDYCRRGITLALMATRVNRRPRRAYRGARNWSVLIVSAAAGAMALLLLPGLYDAWRRSNETAGRALTMEEARETNASIPFVAERGSARSFRFQGSPAARQQAAECLATAAVYEAGDDGEGQKAVMQVVLNRLARPGYPKTVCGIVYQGATRTTGCQFSFSCDGSRARRPEQVGWPTARTAARRALSGHVITPVDAATHYHAD